MEYVLSINVVMPIYTAHVGMVQAQKTFEKAAESIASGLNSYVNPADMYVASGLDTSIRAANKAMENVQSGMNFTAVADSALGNVTDSLQRIRELSVQASSGIYSDSQVAAMQEEINQNIAQIQQTMNSATFNGKQTINVVTPSNPDAAAVVDFMVNPENSQSISYDPNIVMDDMNFDVSTPQAAADTLEKVDSMLSDITSKRGEIGAVQSRFDAAADQLSTSMMSNMRSLSDIQDTDYISAILDLKQSQFTMEAMAKVMKTVMNADKYVLDLLK